MERRVGTGCGSSIVIGRKKERDKDKYQAYSDMLGQRCGRNGLRERYIFWSLSIIAQHMPLKS